MNTVLWVIAILLAIVFLGSGTAKLLFTREQLQPKMQWVEDYSTSTVKFLGACQVLGGIALILPAATGVATILTPIAATCLAVLMALATIVNIRRGETNRATLTIILSILAIFLAVCRFGPYAF